MRRKKIVAPLLIVIAIVMFVSLLIYFSMNKPPTDEQEKLKYILRDDYPVFVTELGDNIKDPKFVAAIKYYASKYPLSYKKMSIPVTSLIPTQNEIDMDKSLARSLKNPDDVRKFLTCSGGEVSVADNSIVTSNSKYIIDGHHRWSQLYVINPACKITSIDIQNVSNPVSALKATQLGIAADITSVPTAKVSGTNLLTSSEDYVKEYVIRNIQADVVDVFRAFGKTTSLDSEVAKREIANYIWGNIYYLQQNSQPISGAYSRNIMPQSDNAIDWKQYASTVY